MGLTRTRAARSKRRQLASTCCIDPLNPKALRRHANEIETRGQMITVREGHFGRAACEFIRENVAQWTIAHRVLKSFCAGQGLATVDANCSGPTLRYEIEQSHRRALWGSLIRRRFQFLRKIVDPVMTAASKNGTLWGIGSENVSRICQIVASSSRDSRLLNCRIARSFGMSNRNPIELDLPDEHSRRDP